MCASGYKKSTYYLMDFDDKLKRLKSVCMNSSDHVLTDKRHTSIFSYQEANGWIWGDLIKLH